MSDIILLKIQQKTLSERIRLTVAQDTLVHNLKATKERSRFIYKANLNLIIYKYEPSDFLELVEEGEQRRYPELFEKYRDFKEKEAARLDYERWLEQERANKTKSNMAGNLALTFLFKDQDLHEIIKFKQGGSGDGAAQDGGSQDKIS